MANSFIWKDPLVLLLAQSGGIEGHLRNQALLDEGMTII